MKRIFFAIGTAALMGLTGPAMAAQDYARYHDYSFANNNLDLYGSFLRGGVATTENLGPVSANPDEYASLFVPPGFIAAGPKVTTTLPGYGDSFGSVLFDTGPQPWLQEFGPPTAR